MRLTTSSPSIHVSPTAIRAMQEQLTLPEPLNPNPVGVVIVPDLPPGVMPVSADYYSDGSVMVTLDDGSRVGYGSAQWSRVKNIAAMWKASDGSAAVLLRSGGVKLYGSAAFSSWLKTGY